jgi:hypothetical protein
MTNDVEIAVKTNASGSAITFEITRLPADPALDKVLVRYRLLKTTGVLPWSDSQPAESPQPGDTITVAGLTEGSFCEFYPVAVDTGSNESDPGNILRVIPSSGSALTKVLQAIASELTNWIPAENIQIAEEFEGKFDPGARAAIVEPASIQTQRVFNTLTWTTCRVRIHLVFGDLDLGQRRQNIESLDRGQGPLREEPELLLGDRRLLRHPRPCGRVRLVRLPEDAGSHRGRGRYSRMHH